MLLFLICLLSYIICNNTYSLSSYTNSYTTSTSINHIQINSLRYIKPHVHNNIISSSIFLCNNIIRYSSVSDSNNNESNLKLNKDIVLENNEDRSTLGWRNPAYNDSYITEQWKLNEHLFTVGASGITKTLMNSLIELTNHHNFVKVKVANDQLNALKIAKLFLENELLSNKVELIEVRPKGFLVGRYEMLPEKVKPPRREFESSTKNKRIGVGSKSVDESKPNKLSLYVPGRKNLLMNRKEFGSKKLSAASPSNRITKSRVKSLNAKASQTTSIRRTARAP